MSDEDIKMQMRAKVRLGEPATWADALAGYLRDVERRAADIKSFHPPRGEGHKEVQGAIAVLRQAITTLEKYNCAN